MSAPYSRPLSELDQVDWARLKHAYGSAEDVPEMIRSLASGDEDALYALYGNLWHQGTVYQATAYAVPFLLGLLEDGHTELLHWLADAAQGASYYDIHQIDVAPMRAAFKTRQQVIAEELHWVQEVYQAVLAGLPVYQRLLLEVDPETPGLTAYLLGTLARDVPQVVDWFVMHLNAPESNVRAAFASELRNFALHSQAVPLLEAQLTDEPLPALMAAITLSHWQGPQVSGHVIQTLLDALIDPDLDELWEELPWQPGEPVALELAAKTVARPDLFVPAFLKRYRETNDPISLEYALTLVAEATEDVRASVLPIALNVLLEAPSFTLDRCGRLLAQLQLPTDRPGLTAFLKELRS